MPYLLPNDRIIRERPCVAVYCHVARKFYLIPTWSCCLFGPFKTQEEVEKFGREYGAKWLPREESQEWMRGCEEYIEMGEFA